jgi:hypothetical protein
MFQSHYTIGCYTLCAVFVSSVPFDAHVLLL